MSEARFDAIVIGSGISGLVSANLLARAGHGVCLLERHHTPGGYLQRFKVRGAPFDAGVHYVGGLGEGQVFDRYLRHLGVTVQARPMRVEGFERLHLPSGPLTLPSGHERHAAAWIERFPHEAEGIRRYMAAIQAEVARFPMYALSGGLKAQGLPDASRTLAQVLDGLISDPALKEALAYPAILYLVHPREAPFTLHAFVLDSYLQGAYTLDGGGEALTDALLERLRSMGGVVELRAEVATLEVRDRRIEGARLKDGRRVEAPLVIAAIDPKQVIRMLPPGATRPVYTKRILGLQEGLSALTGYLRVESDLSEIFGQNQHFMPRGWLEALFEETWVHDPKAPYPFSALVPGASEGAINPISLFTGMSAASWSDFAHTRTGRRGQAYKARKRALLDQQVEAARAMGLPIDPLRSVHGATPLTYRDYTLNSGGAVYGLRHSVDQVGGRGASWRTRVKGLLMTGHSTLFPGLLGSTISAYYACAEVLGLEHLYQELRSL